MPTSPPDRLRWIVPGLGCLAFVVASIWILMHPERGGRGAAIASLLFFGPAGVAMLWSAMKGKAFPRRAATRSRMQHLIVPAVLLVTLPGSLKLPFALPLLAAWLLLFPNYRSTRAAVVAGWAAAAIVLVQALVFAVASASAMAEASSLGAVALQAVFTVLVVCLDAQVLWAARKRLREAAAADRR